VLADASVLRNFGILGWADQLVALAGGNVYVAHGVMGVADDEPGELEGIRASIEDESIRNPGSPAATAATVALVGLDALLNRRSVDVTVLTPTGDELAVAVRLQDREERAWRQALGIRARRLDAGEAVSIAIATNRDFAFASDDDDARVAYMALGGHTHVWTLDLIRKAMRQGLLDDHTARTGYNALRTHYRFWGPPWPPGPD